MANGTNSARTRKTDSVEYLREHKSSGTARSSVGTSAQRSPAVGSTKSTARTAGGTSAKNSTASARKSTGTGKKRRLTKKQRQQRRILVFAVLFLVFAAILLVSTILIVSHVSKRESCASLTVVRPTPSPTPAATPEPITERSLITASVTVNGLPLRGNTLENARTMVVNELSQQMQNMALTVAYNQYAMVLTADKVGLYYDEQALEETLIKAVEAENKTELVVPLSYQQDVLKASLAELNEQLPNHAENAKCEVLYRENVIAGRTYYQPYFQYTEGINGMAVDTEDVLRQVEDALNAGDYTAEIRPDVAISEPPVTVETFKQQTTLLGSFVTTYYFTGTSSTDEDVKLNREGRDTNISKAVGLMNVIQLAPGKTFSYNSTTGSRTEKNGWALAYAIYKSSHRPEAGGGVCQLSTTMYNALLLANVKIVSRRAHTMPIDYVDKGWDATVDDGHIDFKFQNNTGSTLYVFCYITKNSGSSRKKDIHVEVYGQAFPEGTTYKKRDELVEVLPIVEEYIKDKTMYVSDKEIVERKGAEGYIVNTFIDQYVNGQFVKTVYSTTTTYEAITKQIRIGTKADPTAAPTAKPTAKPTEATGEE